MTGTNGGRIRDLVGRLGRFYGPLADPPSDAFSHWLWQVLWLQTAPQARDAALLALRRIPALTPDALARAAPAKVEAALLLAGPNPPDRRRLIGAGADVFRRHRDLDATIRRSLLGGRRALGWLGRLNPVVAHWLLLFAGGHPVVPFDPRICRVAWRLGWGTDRGTPGRQLRSARVALARDAALDVDLIRAAAHAFAHHGVSACTDLVPRCAICPLAASCPRRAVPES